MRARYNKIFASIFSLVLFSVLVCFLDYSGTSWFNKHRTPELDQTLLPSSVFDPILGFKPHYRPHYQSSDPAKARLILMGDSVAYGYGHSYDDQIGTLLHTMAPAVEIINLSGIGFNSLQSYLNLFIYLLDHPWPDYILWLNGPNDVRENMKVEFYISRPEIRKINQNFCVDSYPSGRHPHFFRNTDLNQRQASHIVPELLNEVRRDLQDKFYQSDLLLKILQTGELILCAKEREIPDGQDVSLYLNQKVSRLAERNKSKFFSILLPYKEFYPRYQGNETKEIETKMNSANIEVLNISPLLKNENADSIFLTPMNDPDDHFSSRTHKLIAQSICRKILKDHCLIKELN